MRLNSKTFPIWKYLEHPGMMLNMPLDEAVIGDVASNPKEIMEYLKGIQETAQQVTHRYFVSNTFQKAVEKALPKIETKYTTLDPTPDCGVLLIDGGATMYMTSPGDSDLRLLIYGFTRDSHTCFAAMNKNRQIVGSYRVNEGGELVQRHDLMESWCNSVLALLYFINNCEIETKVMKPGDKMRTTGKNREKHFNESGSEITVLDCSWFTEFVKVNSSKVGGHYRWQPCGEGRKKVKLIYIQDYEKGEYTRKAKKELK